MFSFWTIFISWGLSFQNPPHCRVSTMPLPGTQSISQVCIRYVHRDLCFSLTVASLRLWFMSDLWGHLQNSTDCLNHRENSVPTCCRVILNFQSLYRIKIKIKSASVYLQMICLCSMTFYYSRRIMKRWASKKCGNHCTVVFNHINFVTQIPGRHPPTQWNDHSYIIDGQARHGKVNSWRGKKLDIQASGKENT